MRNDEMAKRFLSWGLSVKDAESKARDIATKSGSEFYGQVAGSIAAEGQNRKARRAKNRLVPHAE